MMLEHITTLKAEDFVDLDDLDVSQTLGAQAETTGFFQRFASSPDSLTADAAEHARQAFAAVTNPHTPPTLAKESVLKLKVPQAVQHLAGMLSQYDWDYVEQAKQLRGYVVAKLMDETKHPDARIRLRALEMVGKLTEVGSFTERIEVKKIDASKDELTERLRAKLATLLPKQIEIQDVSAKSDSDGN
jgi:hypothetical protein